MVDTVKAPSNDSDRIIISRSKDLVTITFLLSYHNADIRDISYCANLLWVDVHHVIPQ